MPKISAELARERRNNILNAAREAFACKGIHISVDEVCEAAGVSKGAFYGYFRSKDALFEALAEAHGEILSDPDTVWDRARLNRMIVDRASLETADFARVELETWSYAIRHPGLRAIFIRNTERLAETLETALSRTSESDADQARRAAVVQLAIQGAFLSMALKGSDAAEESRVALMDLLDLMGLPT